MGGKVYERNILVFSCTLSLKFCEIIAGVHDSFWTHACDVEIMNRILRENFVELYDMPILENVSSHCIIVWAYFLLIHGEKLLLVLLSNIR